MNDVTRSSARCGQRDMAVKIIMGATCLEAWQKAARHVLENRSAAHLVVEIADPSERDVGNGRAHDPRRLLRKAKSLDDVAITIWPARLASRYADRHDLYAAYQQRYARGKRWPRNRHSWGTYCLRLISFGDRGINQLERAIALIGRWQRVTAAFVFHLSSPETDGPRRRGGPCLQYVELLLRDDDTVDMIAVYRSHDYFRLALGNFIGLADLLSFICRETAKNPGRLVVHSVHAFIAEPKRLATRLIEGS